MALALVLAALGQEGLVELVLEQEDMDQVALGLAVLVLVVTDLVEQGQVDIDPVVKGQDWVVPEQDQERLDPVVLPQDQAAMDQVGLVSFLVFILLEVKDWVQESHQNQVMDHPHLEELVMGQVQGWVVPEVVDMVSVVLALGLEVLDQVASALGLGVLDQVVSAQEREALGQVVLAQVREALDQVELAQAQEALDQVVSAQEQGASDQVELAQDQEGLDQVVSAQELEAMDQVVPASVPEAMDQQGRDLEKESHTNLV